MNSNLPILRTSVLRTPQEGSIVHFERPFLAADIAGRLLSQGSLLDIGNRGLIVCAPSGAGKSSFLTTDMSQAFRDERAHCIPIYVHLPKHCAESPGQLISREIKKSVHENTNALGRARRTIVEMLNIKLGGKVKVGGDVVGAELEASVEKRERSVGNDHGIQRLLVELQKDTGKSVVVLIDNIEYALNNPDGQRAIQAIQDAKAQANTDPNKVHITNVFTTGLSGNLQELTGPNEILEGMDIQELPDLDIRYVHHFLKTRMSFLDDQQIPSDAELKDVFKQINKNAKNLEMIASEAIRSSAASFGQALQEACQSHLEFEQIRIGKSLGNPPSPLHMAVLMALSCKGDFTPLHHPSHQHIFEACAQRDVTAAEIDTAVNELVQKNLVWQSHGGGVRLLCNPHIGQFIANDPEYGPLYESVLGESSELDRADEDVESASSRP